MGTEASVTVPSRYRDRLPQVTDQVRAVFERIEDRLSTYKSESETSELARAAGQSPVSVSAETYHVLELSKQYGEATGGALDVTVAPLVRLWGFGAAAPFEMPDPAQVQDALRFVDFRCIELGAGTASVPAGMSVDLGAIGKGFAVDAAFDIPLGVDAAMVDLGGNIRVLGQADPGVMWTIAVRNPFDRDEVLGKLALPNGLAVATSGNYERFVEIAGKRYAHIIDPRSGYPVESMAAVTVVSPDATRADALSTGLFVLGIQEGLRTLEQFPGTEAMFIPDRSAIEVWITPGMAKLFSPLPDIKSSVKILSGRWARESQ
jgi:thiamine biosynthesis lipoprotein